MNLEWFARLKEYDSVLRSRLERLNSIKEQELRLQTLEAKKTERMAQLGELKSEFVSLQGELKTLEEKIHTLAIQRERWMEQGGDDARREKMESEISSLEDKGLEILGKIESQTEVIKDAQTFIDGVGKTIQEISEEARFEITKDQDAIRVIDHRLESLLSLLPDDFRGTLERVQKKNLAHGPFTRIENGSCLFCRYKISRMEESEIDMQKSLRTCPQCSRIFIPYGT